MTLRYPEVNLFDEQMFNVLNPLADPYPGREGCNEQLLPPLLATISMR